MATISWSCGVCMWLFIAIFAIVNGELRLEDPASGKVYTQPGANLHIKVVSTTQGDVAMTMCHQPVGSTTCEEFVPSKTPDYKNYKTQDQITVEYSPRGIGAEAAGTYKVTQGAQTRVIQVNLVKVAIVNGTLEEEGDDVTVACQVSGVDVKYTIKWLRDGQLITQSEAAHVALNDSFTVMGARPKDVGEYNCIVTPVGSVNNITGVAYISSAPFVMKFERGKNLVQGDTVIINCHVYGYPRPVVSWLKQEVPLKTDNRTMVRMYDGIEGAELEIKDLNMEDRADYGCVATNEYNSTTEFISVRVKDTLSCT